MIWLNTKRFIKWEVRTALKIENLQFMNGVKIHNSKLKSKKNLKQLLDVYHLLTIYL